MVRLEIRVRWEFTLFVSVAGAALILSIFLPFGSTLDTRTVMEMVFGTFLLCAGVAYWMTPHCIVEPHKLTVCDFGGLYQRTFQYSSLAELKVENNRLYAFKGGTWKPLPVLGMLLNPDDWQALVQLLSSFR